MTATMDHLPTSLAEAATTLEPVIRRYAGSAEHNRVMAPEIMEALVASGVMRMWVPQAYGGLEADPNESLDVMEQLARIDPATGWVVSNCVFIATLPQFLPEPVRAHIAGDPAIVACGSFVPPGTARATADGYIINGDWSFGSATQYATSIVALTVLVDEQGQLVLDGGNPVSIVAYFTRNDIEFRDTWFTLGLRATGSTNFVAKELAIPKDHAYVLGPWEQKEGPFAGPLYRLGLIMDAVRIAKVGVGIAQGAVDDFVELATVKTPAYTTVITADRATVQERVARAQALVQAGRHTIRTSVSEGWAAVQDGSRITGERCVPMGLAASFALDAAAQAVDLLYQSGGTTAFRDESPLQRRFRDIQTLRQNAIASWSRYESLGKMILGRPSDWPFHQL
jgi:indole-3-acetate monooxygenase